ncbi:hypothetical protein EYC84_001526 [Monilinia fructicola]|uniref:Zn(2)-C6 fungal-type domain-containing protein n=1 Tax=Monilinia fructicola TaxID=38448 RepID=A0A5M9JUH6_MONFR|nr:hypothetical protein EYC84_001526 [Monilinia fructicola]
MDNHPKLAQDDEPPNTLASNTRPNPNESILGIPNLFNNASFAQASIFSNAGQHAMTSPSSTHASIFSDVSRSTNISPISVQTSIFGDVSRGNGGSSKSIIPRPESGQPGAPTPEVDMTANGTRTDADAASNSDADGDPETRRDENDQNEDIVDSNASSRSASSSPEAPDCPGSAPTAKEALPFSFPRTSYRSSPSIEYDPQTSLRDFSIMFSSSNRRHAAIKGQAQRVGAAGADKDDSGTYDPSMEHKRNTRPTRVKKKENGAGDGSLRTGGETVGAAGTRSARKTKAHGSYELIITIGLAGEEGLEYLRKITPGPEGDDRKLSPIREADDEDSGDNDDEEAEYPIHSTRRKKIKLSHNQRSDGLTLQDLSYGHPQRRGCKSCFEAGDDQCSLIEHRHEWPCEGCQDAGVDCELISPPELKVSCIRCREMLRKRRSFADDGGKGVDACQACEEANVKCIAGPKAGSGSSMRMNEVLANVGMKKKQNLKARGGNTKKILPTTSTATTKKSQTMLRKWVPCNRCKYEFKGKCSLKKDDEGPCNRCIKANVPCTFTMLPTILSTPSNSNVKDKGKETEDPKESSPVFRTPQDLTQTIILESTKLNDRVWRTTHPHVRRTKAQQKAFERAQSSDSSDVQLMSTTPMIQPHQSNALAQTSTPSYSQNKVISTALPPNFIMSQNGIRTIIITTAFSHPIIFNYLRDPLSRYPACTFHANPFFGLFGFGAREVTVVPWPSINGAGYEELENGHGDSEVGEEKTRMCVKCTYDRVKILGCEEHVMKILEGVDQRMWDSGMVSKSVQACKCGLDEGRWGKGNGGEPEKGSIAELVWRARWCAVCPSPGAWICEHGGSGRSESGSMQNSNTGKRGCGLILCDTCHELHAKIQKGGRKGRRAVLGRVIQLAGEASRRSDYPDGVRADAGLLREDGELYVRRQMGGCGGTTGEGDVRGRRTAERGVANRGIEAVDADSSGLSKVRSNAHDMGSGERKVKGGARFTVALPATERVDNTLAKKPKGKVVEKPRPRQILDSVMVSEGEVVHELVASIAEIPKWKGKGGDRLKSTQMSDEDENSEGNVAMMEGILEMGRDVTVRRSAAFEGDLTGDGEISGKWKGKGVDRRVNDMARNVERDLDMDVNMEEGKVTKSVDNEWEFREIIELSD